MIRSLLLTALLLTGGIGSALAQAAANGPDVAGVWDGRSMLGPKDSIVARYVLTLEAGGTGTLALPNRDPIASRVVAMGGDSLVMETEPYASVLRKGLTVTVHTVGHFKDGEMTGTYESRYSSGDVTRGKTAATRRK